MNKLMRLIIVTVLIMLVGDAGKVFGDRVIDDPDKLVGSGNSQDIRMETAGVDNLRERIDGTDDVVDKGLGEYYIFFGKDDSGGIVFGGYVGTNNAWSDFGDIYKGYCQGRIDRDVFSEGSSPDYALAIYDNNGGRFALLNQATGALSFDENIVAWESGYSFMPSSGEIEYDGVLNGIVGGLIFDVPLGSDVIFERTVLVPPVILVFPINNALGVDPNTVLEWEENGISTYDVYFDTDPNLPDVVSSNDTDGIYHPGNLDWKTTYYWKVNMVEGGEVLSSSEIWSLETSDYECEVDLVGDLNVDCVVNLADFVMMAGNWLVETQKIPASP